MIHSTVGHFGPPWVLTSDFGHKKKSHWMTWGLVPLKKRTMWVNRDGIINLCLTVFKLQRYVSLLWVNQQLLRHFIKERTEERRWSIATERRIVGCCCDCGLSVQSSETSTGLDKQSLMWRLIRLKLHINDVTAETLSEMDWNSIFTQTKKTTL